ncbi:hypothetical protein COW36_07180 [bacterium (Candidatus Blackallbacteria) CG17_big_fil_post_rev_8_21_14_2_50_48_46]|uniref:Uncharacterized protein n=1 Tax=bacterium (Candidatus Blackallbacteria) CG17_big_fil_post_rev_8_21_14_2_50_48_46 TaxID=2014261 RepID=A0A2M7G7W1_9BACT|nr:MAG: hypothetical protein COW64_06690 [bacterium (Candidatus Blackallbacteria) CG18_big_fil_WC_8_21_14_2_50_49_26]PIW17844.1 MAG: hypothetical protein COW36_07180 [bacterium (Candidatus Blackallbacteria) CG17_big_fil_post_rev_8_21_14_2_50_48_46]PIW48520.1 MAG: hypothetical protein COW20_09135 [bacterium (Candidatus Blackallbacteria) CG13_big_fil_rev_8_21_14_2_50_49_14]
MGNIRTGSSIAQVNQWSDETLYSRGHKGTFDNKEAAIRQAEHVAASDTEDAAVVEENGRYSVYAITEIGTQDPSANAVGNYEVHDFAANIVAFSATQRNQDGQRIRGEVTKQVSGSSTNITFSTDAVTAENMPEQANLGLFARQVTAAAPGSGASLQLSLGVKAGAPGGTGVSMALRGTAELSVTKGTGVGAPYVAKLDLGLEAEAAVSLFGNSASVEMARSLSNGVAFYNEAQVQEFARRSVVLTGKIASGDIDGARAALSNLSAYADQHRYTATNARETVSGETATGTKVEFNQTRDTTTLDSYQDTDKDGNWDANESRMRERVREEGYSGSFQTRIGGQTVTVSVATLEATLEERRLTSPSGRVTTESGESSRASKIRVGISPSALRGASDNQLVGIIEQALGVSPGLGSSGLSGAQIRQFIPALRDAASKETRAGTFVFELAHLRESDGTGGNRGTTMLRFGVSANYSGEIEMPVATGLQITAGVETSATYLREIARW